MTDAPTYPFRLTEEERARIDADLMAYGQTIWRTNRDGTRERIAPEDFVILKKPQEAP